MASEAERRREILAALRAARTRERMLDSGLERYERELIRLRSRKTRILSDEIGKVATLWDQLRPLINDAQDALSTFISMVTY